MACVAVLHVFGGKGEVVEACLCCDFDAAVSRCAEDRYAFQGRKVHDVKWEVWSEVGEREDLFDGVGFEGWRSGIKECMIGCQGS